MNKIKIKPRLAGVPNALLANLILLLIIICAGCSDRKEKQYSYINRVNPFIGTAPLLDTSIIGYTPPEGWRVWAGLVYPGISLPNAMVQLSPITQFGSGAGYEYEDTVIYGFAHTNKGHWNLCHIPVLPATGQLEAKNISSRFDHENEKAMPGYYQVLLKGYGIDVELTSTLRCGFHKYHFPENAGKKIVFSLAKSNERVKSYDLQKAGKNAVSGYQETGGKVFFYAVFNHDIDRITTLSDKEKSGYSVVHLASRNNKPVEMKIGLSFVSAENAKENLQKEIGEKGFEKVKEEAFCIWENHLAKIKVAGGTEKQKELFYSSLYRSFLWPALRSDVNGEYRDATGNVVQADFNYYTRPSLWDTYRNKLVLMAMLSPEVTTDVIKSLIDVGKKTGFIPTFFHGDHAAPFISGSYLRGIDSFDLEKAYQLLLRNANVEGGTRPYIGEYKAKGYISTPRIENPHVETKAKAAVTKTLEYAYDDYAVALLAKILGDSANYNDLMKRSQYYRNVFDPASGFMRGRLENGAWVENFNPQYPYYEYMYREANAWQSTFFVPHDVPGLIELYGGREKIGAKLDSLFTIPWNSQYIARNVSGFIGQYCHGNQPDHSTPYLYYYLDQQEKAQHILDTIMNHYYGIGEEGLALCGMDDAGEMSSWYVFNAMGFYPFSPADDDYIITVPMFSEILLQMPDSKPFRITRNGEGKKIGDVALNGKQLPGFKLLHSQMKGGGELVISVGK